MAEFPLTDDVLFIGHSLVGIEMPAMLEDAVDARGGGGGVRFQVTNGAPLAWNWEHSASAQGVDARAILPEGETEVVVLTEAAPIGNHVTWNATDRHARAFHDLAVASNPAARVYLYETWPSIDSGTGVDVPYDEEDHIPWRARIDADRAVWEGVVAAVNAGRDPGAPRMRLVPVGQALARLHDAIAQGEAAGLADVRALFSDDIHLNDLGNYFATMVQFATLYGRDPRGLPRQFHDAWGGAFEAPPPALAARLQEIAWETVRDNPLAGLRADAAAPGAVEAKTGDVAGSDMADSGMADSDMADSGMADSGMADSGMADSGAADSGAADLAAPPADVAAAPGVNSDAAAAGANPGAAPGLAMGLAGIADWSTQNPFIDAMKSARPWIGHLPGRWGGWDHADLAAAGALDAQGWPRRLPAALTGIATVILNEQPAEAVSLAGRYRLAWRGAGEIRLDGRARVVSARPGAIVFDYAPGPGGVVLTITATDPRGMGDHIRDITAVKEEDRARHAAGAVFNPDWLARIAGLGALRFMDWMQTNGSTVAAWDARPLPSDYSYAWRGAPAEVMVDLANALDADPWFTMPHRAEDGYFRGFAELVRDRLEPGRTAHVEYSNEVWNWVFPQAHWARDAAAARWGAAAPGDAWLQFAGLRAARMAQIWDEAFGPEAERRLVKVMATQTGWLGLEAALLTAPLRDADADAPASAFDAYAVTGYFSGALGSDTKAPAVLDWIADSRAAAERGADALGLRGAARAAHVEAHRFDAAATLAVAELRDGSVTGDADGSVAEFLCSLLPYHAEVAREYGLDLVMYEGGSHLAGVGPWAENADLTAFFTHLSYAPEMGDLYRRVLDGWAAVSAAPFNAYVDVAPPGRWGSWGALRHLDDANPRWAALHEPPTPGADCPPAPR